MQAKTIYHQMQDAVKFIKKKTSLQPEVGLVLGSGLGSVADEMENPIVINYTDIPHFHATEVAGHAGKLIVGKINGVATALLQGRFHGYEGHSIEAVVLPTRTLCALGIRTLILTNAAGGINSRFRPGDLMIIEDHLNLSGDNPLRGPNLPELGPRFPDMTEAYPKVCVEAFEESAKHLKLTIQKGIYAGLSGPCYETPAEVRMLRLLGADAVGMSTVSESIAANHMGVRVAGLSCITNLAADLSPEKLSHQEVMETSKAATDKIKKLLVETLPRLARLK
jgi:purine-nucleoside phosphorylase